MLDDLTAPEAILADTWQRLVKAATDRTSAFQTPSVSLVDEIAGVTSRIVVLRRVDVAQRVLFFHTDRRSPKFEALQHDATTAWLFYDPVDRLQLRAQSTATLHTTDAIAHEQWRASSELTRGMYRTPLASGMELPSLMTEPPAPTSDGRDHFAVVRCVVESIDWLYLRHGGHRRMRFRFAGESVSCAWLAP